MFHPQSIEQDTYHSETELSQSVKTFFTFLYKNVISTLYLPVWMIDSYKVVLRGWMNMKYLFWVFDDFANEYFWDWKGQYCFFSNQKLLRIIFIFLSFLVAFNIDYAALRRFVADFFFREHHFAFVCWSLIIKLHFTFNSFVQNDF